MENTIGKRFRTLRVVYNLALEKERGVSQIFRYLSVADSGFPTADVVSKKT
jgi:hypothetical protein